MLAHPLLSERVLAALKRTARALLRRPQPPAVVRTHPFDALHGVETSGLLEAKHLFTGHANDAFSTAYFGVPPSRFTGAVEQWSRTPGTAPIEQVRLIDVGCGKGRAVLLASLMPFRDVIGVELNPELAATAQTNLASWRQQNPLAADASILTGDGPSILPCYLAGPVLIYLYNPFRAPVLRSMLAAVLDQRSTLAAAVDVLYLFPEHEDVFQEFPDFQQLWHAQIGLAPEDANDGLSAPFDPCSLYRLTPISP